MGVVKHGLCLTEESRKIYDAWINIKCRCFNESHKSYEKYGGRGITLQMSWVDDPVAFYKYVSSLPNCGKFYSLDRVDNRKNYEEGNLRWATPLQQVTNTSKRSNTKTNITGVTWHVANKTNNNPGNFYYLATYHDLCGKQVITRFSVKKYGLLPAFKMACDYREKMIAELNAQGAGYTENHGK